MAKLLFKMRGVPDEEAEELRNLLNDHGFSFYETDAGNWGLSVPAVWLANAEEYGRARELIDAWQEQRSARIRQERQEAQSRGDANTAWRMFQNDPLRFLLSIALVALVLYISLRWFLFPRS